jgi:hypothetical protein
MGDRRKFGTAIERWASVGPYYAMFPVAFAFRVIKNYTSDGDLVLDPFAGRASSVYAAAALGRSGLGIEINPVGWLYGSVKLRPANQELVLKRLDAIASKASTRTIRQTTEDLPPFFTAAYHVDARRFLVAARSMLCWRTRSVDATLMALILVYLHGKRGASFSNQMRDGKAMSPQYAIDWWKAEDLRPPNVDPLEFLSERITWRYAKGAPALDGDIRLGDSARVLASFKSHLVGVRKGRFDLLFTSPPYRGVTNYYYDQWLRRWMLGGLPSPIAVGGRWRGKFQSRVGYKQLLMNVFGQAAACMKKNATVYVRTDARSFTKRTTLEVLRLVFPNKSVSVYNRPLSKRSQTALYGDKKVKPGEVDIVMRAG